jgi:hypothetical protein
MTEERQGTIKGRESFQVGVVYVFKSVVVRRLMKGVEKEFDGHGR